ncbi:hypothetical protein [Algicella marina]|nr:hypothetical protein [Algicella marina]
MDKVVSLGFVLCAAIAIFISMNKTAIQEEGFSTVVASYIEG